LRAKLSSIIDSYLNVQQDDNIAAELVGLKLAA